MTSPARNLKHCIHTATVALAATCLLAAPALAGSPRGIGTIAAPPPPPLVSITCKGNPDCTTLRTWCLSAKMFFSGSYDSNGVLQSGSCSANAPKP